MSNDLISRKDAERMIHDYFTSLIEKHIQEIDVVDCNAELQKRLDNISVAYDVEKVVGKIYKEQEKEFIANEVPIGCIGCAEVVEIVKEGGVNES